MFFSFLIIGYQLLIGIFRSSLTANEKVKNWQEKLSDYREVKQVESEKVNNKLDQVITKVIIDLITYSFYFYISNDFVA